MPFAKCSQKKAVEMDSDNVEKDSELLLLSRSRVAHCDSVKTLVESPVTRTAGLFRNEHTCKVSKRARISCKSAPPCYNEDSSKLAIHSRYAIRIFNTQMFYSNSNTCILM